MKHTMLPSLFCTAFLCVGVTASVVGEVHMANGIKVGEVEADSAIIWTRLTRDSERNIAGKMFEGKGKPEDQAEFDLEKMQGSVLGQSGEIRVTYWPKGAAKKAASLDWQLVDGSTDFIHQFELNDLLPDTRYEVLAEGRTGESTCQVAGGFRTAPDQADATDVSFVVTTCGDYPRRDDPDNGHVIYTSMLELDPHFFVHAGDIEYYDKPAPYAVNLELARFKWNRLYAMPFLRTFHNQVSSYFIKDDHDTVKNDCWPGANYFDLTWEQGLATFREQVPMGEKTYRTRRWGKDLQVWMVEGRDFRSPNRDPDGPEKSIWGKEQKQWFFDTVLASDATFKVLISPTPVVGPDRDNKKDSHANSVFQYEGNQLREFMAAQGNLFVVCGDRHWQYASVDPKTGLREFSCGPASDIHAGGYKEEYRKDMHRFLRIKGGFLSVNVKAQSQEITFRHHRVDGSVRNEESFKAD